MKKVEDIKNPDFLKKYDINEFETLSSDIREFILNNVSKNGGHLSANLGIVDLTIALLKVFDAKKDKIIFDVGHQCYTYKILTGRAKDFSTLRKKGGLSGFQSRKESIYDVYEAGHSSTSVSAGLGFAIARDLNHEKHNVISVIGDGSFSNGLVYEALNQIGDIKTKQIIILNDNQMSISQNVGAIHNFLDKIRADKKYEKAKKKTKNFLKKSHLGERIFNRISHFKNDMKTIYLKNGAFFQSLGIEYYGPINGHDYKELLQYMEIAKNEEKPVILHIITEKGKGYEIAEKDTEGKYHGISAFNIETGEVTSKTNLPSYSEIISSYVYNYAKKDKDIICITPAMSLGSKLNIIKEKLPNQYIDVGIAEEHALIEANSLALAGKKPIVFIYSTFLQRAYDEIIHDIARMNSHVILCIDRAGAVPSDGISHQGIYDISFMLSIPNMVITMPKDAAEANTLINAALKYNGPFAIRYPKINIKYDYQTAKEIEIGSWTMEKEGKEAYIISYGDFVNRSLKIAEKAKEENNLDIGVINARFIKPIDKKLLDKVLKSTKNIFVYEESTYIGSLGSIISMYKDENGYDNNIVTYAFNDTFLEHASREELIKDAGLNEEDIYKKIINKIND